jgi:hypothetical protein
MDIRKIDRINQFIIRKSTGTPASFARRIGMSERTLYSFLSFMKKDLGAPIRYSELKQTYYYTESGELFLKWKAS